MAVFLKQSDYLNRGKLIIANSDVVFMPSILVQKKSLNRIIPFNLSRNFLALVVLLLIVGCSNDNPTNSDSANEEQEVTAPPSATIDLSVDKQVIRGFGAANILPWRPDMTDSEIDLAFGTGPGQLGFSILRLMVQEDSNDWDMNISTAKKAYDRGVLIFASPWNAPDELLKPGPEPDTLAEDKYDEYANHLNSYNNFLENNGVDLYAISVQNEPDYANTWTGWTPASMLDFMRNHASAIDTRVIAPESFQFRRNMSDPLLNDPEANKELDIVGGHIYGGGLEPYPLAEEKGKEVWMTEHYTTSDRSANLWPDALEVGSEIQRVMNANMNAYIWWYIVRYYGPIADGEEGTTKGKITRRGYVMSHFSRFIRPGFQRKEATFNPQSNVLVTAYEGEEKLIIVALNSGSYSRPQKFVIENSDRQVDAVSPYVTTSSSNMSQEESISVSSDSSDFVFDIPPQSIVTFVEE